MLRSSIRLLRNCYRAYSSGIPEYNQSYCDFGNNAGDQYGLNSVHDNYPYNAAVGLSYPSDPAALTAYKNWWGSNPPDASLFYCSSACQLNNGNSLSSDP
ncbi:MAG: hypothetical protein M1469_08240 [Bacteroidetes bacterium]|nr:hypothetical protein [Bacteroidota bacterium]MCL5268078.1 hypothetical protein [Bacteroidota bacterium]